MIEGHEYQYDIEFTSDYAKLNHLPNRVLKIKDSIATFGWTNQHSFNLQTEDLTSTELVAVGDEDEAETVTTNVVSVFVMDVRNFHELAIGEEKQLGCVKFTRAE